MNTPLTTLTAKSVLLAGDNIDTDAIIPSREIKGVSKTGLKDGLFANWRYVNGHAPDPDFVLNNAENRDARILLTGANFGCGSSREQAVWALKEYGFQVIVAQSFGEIFYKNCIDNGLLPIRLPAEKITLLAKSTAPLRLDLPAQTLNGLPFDIPISEKTMLTEGLDAIALSLKFKDEITAFEQDHFKARPWVKL